MGDKACKTYVSLSKPKKRKLSEPTNLRKKKIEKPQHQKGSGERQPQEHSLRLINE